MNEVLAMDAIAQAEVIRRGELHPKELVRMAIDAAEALNPRLNAIITPMYEEALEAAEGPLPDGPFKGVPMLLKDGIATYRGVPLSSGSALLRGFEPGLDSELVTRFKRAGFIIIGKTNMPEFGLLPTTEPTAFGPTHNPWDVERTPGGSSGGSAAAVAAGIVALAHGNDGGGSIRIPASCCGLFGLKPTRGRNPLGPAFSELVSGLVEEHVLTRSVRDSAAVLDETAGEFRYPFYCAPAKKGSFLEALRQTPRKMRIGFCTTTVFGGTIEGDCVEATQKAAEMCRDFGHEVIEMKLPLNTSAKELGEIFGALWAICTTTPIAVVKKRTGLLPPRHMLEPLTWALYEQAQKLTGTDYEFARQAMHRAARDIQSAFAEIDIWLSATLAKPPLPLGVFAQNEDDPMTPSRVASDFSPMTAIFNISGQPAASVPVYWNREGLPVGVQLVGKFGDDYSVLQLSAQLEDNLNWQQKRPPVFIH